MITPRLLRTRVARRLVTLFLLCAVGPVATFAILTYRLTADRLESDARDALRHSSKTAAMIVMDRLKSLTTELGTSGSRPSFEALASEGSDSSLTLLRGEFGAPPALTRAQQAQLLRGSPVILTEVAPGSSWILLGLPAPGSSTGYPHLWGKVSPNQIGGADPSRSPAPEGDELCLLDAKGVPLDCPSAGAARTLLEALHRPTGEPSWQRGDSVFLMAHWNLFLGREFAALPWSIALSTPKAAALLPLAAFRRTFFLGVVLAGLLVFVLSSSQLRKRMTPLSELEAGVRRVSSGDFTTPVVVRSNDEFEILARSFNGMASDLQHHFTTLTALRAVDVAALGARSARAIADAALKWAPQLLHGDRAAVAFASTENPSCWTVLSAAPGGRDQRGGTASPTSAELDELNASPELLLLSGGTSDRSYCGAEHLPSAQERVVFPLRHGGRVHAALIVGRDHGRPFSIPTISLARQLADQLALGLSSVMLLDELDALSLGSMLALARTIDAVSPWTGGHSERVTQTAMEIGRRLGFDAAALDRLRRGGLLHDIGKIGVPATILDKPGPLTAAERVRIQSHPVVGAKIISPIAAFQELVPLVLHHHELLDGSGYPDGLVAAEIPEIVRVLTVADIHDALISDRPYRAGFPPAEALAILREGAGRKYDARAVGALEDAVREGWSAAPIAGPVGDPSGALLPVPGDHDAITNEEILV